MGGMGSPTLRCPGTPAAQGTHSTQGWGCRGSTGWAVTTLHPPRDEPPVLELGQTRYWGPGQLHSLQISAKQKTNANYTA